MDKENDLQVLCTCVQKIDHRLQYCARRWGERERRQERERGEMITAEGR